MLWGCVAGAGTGNLVKVEVCMDSTKYQLVLENNVPESVTKSKLRQGWIFQQDPKVSKSNKAFTQRNNYNVLEWPSQSIDLNSIEFCPRSDPEKKIVFFSLHQRQDETEFLFFLFYNQLFFPPE